MSPTFTAQDLAKAGLSLPAGQLTLALQTLIWDITPPPPPPGKIKEDQVPKENGKNGILLFGPQNCGMDHIVHAVLLQAERGIVQEIIVDWKSHLQDPNPLGYIRTIFRTAVAARRAVIIVPDFDDLLKAPQIREEALLQIHSLANAKNSTVFIVATAKTPWTIGEKCLEVCFKKKIEVPGPTLKDRAALLKHFLEEKGTANKCENICGFPDSEFSYIAGLESLKSASWQDLKQVVDDCWNSSLQEGVRVYQALYQDTNHHPTEDEMTAIKWSLSISKEELRGAGARFKKATSNPSPEEVGKFRRFKEKWSKEYKVLENNTEYYKYSYPDNKGRKQTWCDKILQFIADMTETWF